MRKAPDVAESKQGRILGLPAFLAPLIAGAGLALAFPPSFLWWLAPFALLPFYQHLSRGGGFSTGFLTGLSFYTGTVYWIALNLDVPLALGLLTLMGSVLWLSALLGLTTALTALLMKRLGPWALWMHPFILIVFEAYSESTEMAFPWPCFGATQILNPVMKPLAALGGLSALTLSLMLGALILFSLLKRMENGYSRKSLAGTALLLPLWLLVSFSLGKLSQGEVIEVGAPVDILLVQANMDPIEKWAKPASFTVNRHLDLTRAALIGKTPPDLVIWPETAVPASLTRRKDIQLQLQNFCKEFQTSLLTGANGRVSQEGLIRPVNGSFLIDESGIIDVYHKVRLVPFGERIPGQKWFPFLRKIHLGQAEFAVGRNLELASLPLSTGDSLLFARTICFEENFGLHVREQLGRRGELIVNQTNDAWFRTSRELDQHFALATLRCVETGRSLVRATNNGFTSWVNMDGVVMEQLPKGVAGTLRVQVPRTRRSTFFMHFGNLLPKFSFLLLTWAVLLAAFGRSKKVAATILFLGFALSASAISSTDHTLLSGVSSTRALSMGGCFAASSQQTDAHLFNPASLIDGPGDPEWRIFLDPVSYLTAGAGEGAPDKASPLLLVKQLQFRGRHWAVAFVPAERRVPDVAYMSTQRDEDPVLVDDIFPSMTLAFAIDQRIRLGLALAWHTDPNGGSRQPSVNYGAIIHANPWVDVGVQAVYLPSGSADSRRQLEQIGDGTINVGIAYRPFAPSRRSASDHRFSPWNRPDFLVAIDVRNVTQDVGLGERQEVHFGTEIVWPQILALRAGVFWPRASAWIIGQPRFSAGLGFRLPSFLRVSHLREQSIDLGWIADPLSKNSVIWMGTWKWAF